MRSNGNNSIGGRRNHAGSDTTTTTTLGGHGAALPRRASSGNDQPKEAEGWFKPVGISPSESGALNQEDISDCPGGICPVPWATKDDVNHPAHYTTNGGIECIEAIEAQLTPEEYRGYLKGNCVKYLWREKYKGGRQSVEKCQWYLTRLLDLD